MSVCLCTGCELYDPVHRRQVHGDLHMVTRGIFVFNAVVTGTKCEAAWHWNIDPPRSELVRAIVLPQSPRNWFERRGVFVMAEAAFTDALRHYIDQMAVEWR